MDVLLEDVTALVWVSIAIWGGISLHAFGVVWTFCPVQYGAGFGCFGLAITGCGVHRITQHGWAYCYVRVLAGYW